jgi:hypothetical protein
LAAFVPTFLSKVRLSKISEATEQLASLHHATAAYYETPHRIAGRARSMCLPEGAGPTPKAPSSTLVPVAFAADETDGHETWRALGLSDAEVRYSYTLVVPAPGCGPRTSMPYPLVTYRAEGDLDDDGVHSLLERTAAAATGDPSTLRSTPILRIVQRVE